MSTAAINGERPPSAPILLTSDAFDERDRFDAWREELMLRVMRVDVDVPDKRSFHTRLRVLILPNVSIIERRSTPSVVRRTAELVRDGDDSLAFSLPWRKSIEARGSAAEGFGDSEISFPLLYDSQGNNNVTFAAPYVENPSYPGTTIISCCNTGFYDGINPPIFTGGPRF